MAKVLWGQDQSQRDRIAPYPWHGGKSRAAPLIWQRLGEVRNLTVPFWGSGSEVLNCPWHIKVVNANDRDGFVINFWRATIAAPDEVAVHTAAPMHETEIYARHKWLNERRATLTTQLEDDPDFYDARIAGYWCYGVSAYIGDGWCSGTEYRKLPNMGGSTGGSGVHKLQVQDEGKTPRQLPAMGGCGGSGIHATQNQTASGRYAAHLEWFEGLKRRLEHVRFACGDWKRILSPSCLEARSGSKEKGRKHSAIILDPPYKTGNMDYSVGGDVAADVEAWCREHGNDPWLMICLCGHAGDYDLPGWEIVPWKARGGYGNQGGDDAEDNRHRECLWFSPGCLRAAQGSIFDG